MNMNRTSYNSVQRSSLILPVNNRRFVEKAHLRGADAVILDLEDSIPNSEKDNARNMVKNSIGVAGRGGSLVLVRVNNEKTMLYLDLYASVHPGLHGIVLPMVETRQEVMELESIVEKLEKEQNLEVGQIRFSLIIESPRGLLNAYDIALASQRVESMTIGPEDYCLKLGVEPSNDGIELLYPLSQIVTICKTIGIMPMGLLGSIAGFQDLEAFERSASRARQLGCVGAACIHPKQVEVLNRVFSPSPEEIKFAQRVVAAFEDGLSKGIASVNLDGKMVDIPVYKRAKQIALRAEAIERTEQAKRESLLQTQ